MKKNNHIFPAESIVCLAHRFESIANKYVFYPMGLSAISMKILKLLKVHGRLTASDLIEMTSSTKSNMSQRLNFLEKEKYIQQSEEMYSILFFEGFAGRFGKNLAAIILVGLFSFGYTWKYISNYVLFILLFCSFAWLFLVNYLKIKKQ